METYPFFLAFALLVFATDSAGLFSYWRAWMYLIGRLLFLPLYAIGIPWLRTISWQIATLGLILVGAQLFTG